MTNLKAYGLTVDNILKISNEKLNELIKVVGFHRKKVDYIKNTTKILKEKYDGDIPPTVEEMMELPGVGPKMSHLLMQVGWNKTVGIGVDVHVNRISNRLGWVKNTNSRTNKDGIRSLVTIRILEQNKCSICRIWTNNMQTCTS